MIIPTIPGFPAGYVATAADLNNVAAACTFLLGKPRARVHDSTGGQTLGTTQATATAINWSGKDYDNDSTWNAGTPSHLTVQTNGWYRVRYSIQVTSTSGYIGNAFVVATAGPNNPLGNGVVIGKAMFGYADAGPVASVPAFASASGIYPNYLYAGDTLTVKAWSSNTGDHTSATSTWPVSSFAILYASA